MKSIPATAETWPFDFYLRRAIIAADECWWGIIADKFELLAVWKFLSANMKRFA
ncbi:hypothetical protein NUV25_30325 [Burkholderia pseudomultivorans]|uniref:hypothetical protein n=1 Tax=Burkholderia pseudomultivorans TaxID=1207504 RepID=UPI0012D9BBD2|nr:hypothetical protein [Burkholderia pseudomultivorans]MDS0862010.1 hypothetical protein [Burkholderia pseudomultivorans]